MYSVRFHCDRFMQWWRHFPMGALTRNREIWDCMTYFKMKYKCLLWPEVNHEDSDLWLQFTEEAGVAVTPWCLLHVEGNHESCHFVFVHILTVAFFTLKANYCQLLTTFGNVVILCKHAHICMCTQKPWYLGKSCILPVHPSGWELCLKIVVYSALF